MAGGSIDGSGTSHSNSVDSQLVKDPSPFRFTWRIDRFSQMITEKLYSDVFEVGGYNWRLLMFPKGNNVDYLSMYLDVADIYNLPEGWSKFAQFSLAVVNQIHTKFSRKKDSQHQFNEQASDWGFTSFIPLNEFFDPSRGYLVNDTIVVEVEVICDAKEEEEGSMAGCIIDGSKTSHSNSVDSQLVKDPAPFRFTWKIDRFSQMITKKLHSDVFEVGGYKWRVLMFPKGNYVDCLSMYLDVADSSSLPEGWTRFARFSLALISQIHTKYSRKKDSHHQFNEHESDWGFTSFIPLNEFFDPSRGYLLNDTLVVEVEVICDAEEEEEEGGSMDGSKTSHSNSVDSQIVKDPSPFRFTWRIDRFSQMIMKKLYSDVFEVGGYKWRVLMFPKGNHVDCLSMYLDVADSSSLPEGWTRFARFSLELISQFHTKYSQKKDSHHQFNEQERDWGFTSFIPLNKLFDPSRGYLVNDTLVVEVEVICDEDENDTAEHLRERLKKDQEDVCTIIKVVRDEDLAEQIGNGICFDLVDHDKVKSFRVRRDTSFYIFKEEVAKELGIPAQFQRFWLWARRKNHTYRPFRPLTETEEAGTVGQLRRVKKVKDAELKLFLEVERGRDLRPIAPLNKKCDDILLFFKLYDPDEEELRYVGRLFVNPSDKLSEILTSLNKLAGYDPDEEIELYEEIMFEPNVMCDPVDKNLTFLESQLENGDIICFQKASAMDNGKHIRNPDVPSYLQYMHNLQFSFSPSAKESEYEESLVEQNNIIAEETNDEKNTEASLVEQNNNIISEEPNVDKNTEAQPLKLKIETTHDEGTCKANTKFGSIVLEEMNAMIDENVIAAIDRVLSEGIAISIQSQHSVQEQEVSRLYSNLPEQLLQELRDIAFKEDLFEKFKKGVIPEINFIAVMEKIDANADIFSSHQLEQVDAVKDLLNNLMRIFEKMENLKKVQDSAKKSTDEDTEALKKTRQKILTSQSSFTNNQKQLNSLDGEIADLKAKLEKLQSDRDNIAEIQDQEKDDITSLNKEVKSIFQRLMDDHIKFKAVEDKIPEAQADLENYEKLYQFMKAAPPF